MTELQTIAIGYIVVIVLRLPRIKERWAAPLLRGSEWFFDVAVPPDFGKSGGAILRYYRWRLFIPWGIEVPSVAAFYFTGNLNIRNLAVLILTITVFTRFNYYAARIAAEKRARDSSARSKALPHPVSSYPFSRARFGLYQLVG